MKKFFKSLGKWGIRLFLLTLLIVVLDAIILAFPYPLFPNKIRYNNYIVYSDGDLDTSYINIVAEARNRNEATGVFRPDHEYSIFICQSQKLYSFFAFLCRKTPKSQGIGLTLLNRIYVSEPRISHMKSVSPPYPTYSFLDGNLAGVISHEVGHLDTEAAIGFGKYIKLPFWKSKGYAEYAANHKTARDIPEYDLRNRIALLYDDSFWGDKRSHAHPMYESQLMIEFLHDIKGYDFATIMDPSTTKEMTLKDMYGWYQME